uniref:Uncharacterized protein n=1 Tax=Cucumis melo TaxID=3656 RepID=A0A9I9EGM4_CUCME
MGLRPECLLGPPYYTVVPCPHWMLLSKKYYLKKNVLASISLNILMLFFSALIHHLEHQLISSSSSALAVSPGNRWLLDSACCNHMTSNFSLMNTPSSAKYLPPIYASDDNC